MNKIDLARQAGVTRGINASIEAIENLRSVRDKRSSGYHDLTLAIMTLQKLSFTGVEEISTKPATTCTKCESVQTDPSDDGLCGGCFDEEFGL